MEVPDLYAILQVSPTAGQEEIRRAYRALVRKHHPDLNGPQEDGAARARSHAMSAILHAYAVLSDPARRADYDRQRGNAQRTDQKAPRGQPVQVRVRVRVNDDTEPGWTLRPEDVVRIFPPESPLRAPRDVFEALVRRWFLR